MMMFVDNAEQSWAFATRKGEPGNDASGVLGKLFLMRFKSS